VTKRKEKNNSRDNFSNCENVLSIQQCEKVFFIIWLNKQHVIWRDSSSRMENE